MSKLFVTSPNEGRQIFRSVTEASTAIVIAMSTSNLICADHLSPATPLDHYSLRQKTYYCKILQSLAATQVEVLNNISNSQLQLLQLD